MTRVRSGETRQWERVSAAELIRGFGTWQARALHGPIVVTHRGRDALLLGPYVSGDAAPPAPVGADLLDDVLESILTLDRDLRVVNMNRAARDLLGRGFLADPHVPLGSLLPGWGDALIQRHLLRTLHTGEIFSGDVPSPLRQDGWMRLKIVRMGEGLALILRDVTDELAAFNRSDVKNSIVESIDALGTIGYARVSLRGMIERASVSLCERIGASGEAIRRVAFAALMPMRDRAAFNERLEAVMQERQPLRLAGRLVARSGEEIAVDLSLAPIHGLYAAEGATVLASWRQ